MAHSAVLVEGESDKAALLALARRRGSDLGAGGVTVMVMNGATNIGRFVAEAVAKGVRVAALYDVGEQAHMVRALADVGLTDGRDPDALEQHGFFVCDPDLEGELIRAVGAEGVLEVIAEQEEDARRFAKLQQMPEWRGRPVEDQLRRWFGSGGSRKVRYAALLVGACPMEQMPRPLVSVLEHATGDS